MRAFPPAWPKQPEAFTVVKQADDLLLKEDLWLADARDFLRNGPQWPMADMSKAPRTELPRRLQSVNFLAWQKGQLTEHLRRKSEQTLVAAADLRELIVAVQRDAASIQEEEEALCQAEEELLVGRQRCARELQQLWEDLDVREKALEEAALEALDVEAGEELHQAQQLSEAVCEQAGDLQEETALLFDLHQDLETREAALHCSEVAFGCLVERELSLEGLENLREGIAKQLSEMMALGDSACEAVLTSVGGVGWTEGDFPVSDSERGDLAPSSARLVYPSRDDTSTGRKTNVRKSDARASTPESPKDDYSLEAEEEFFYEEGEEEAEDDPDPEVELEEEEEQVELLPQRLDPLLGTVDSSPGALPSESCFIGVPADANAQASNASVSNASASATARVPAPWVPAAYPQVNRSSFPLPSAGAYPPRVAVAPLAKFPVSYCPRPATSPGRAAYVQVVAPKR